MSTPVQQGEILAGKYRVDRVLGEGGMGVVVAAHHLELDDKVAIKFLLPDTLSNPEAVARFSREARAAVKIKSEHVARVSDVGKLENGSPYMVMEYLEGSDLSGWLTERGPLPIEQAIEFVLQASEAIAEAHALGIVHRDLKPANLFVIRRADGALSIKVLDFGISKMTSLSGSGGEGSMTKTSTMMGSPIYMSPEQIQSSKDVDARGDIWALGIILYELIMGVPPFGGDHITGLIYSIISTPPPAMRARRPEVPPGLEAVIFHCLEKQRANRFGSIAEMASALLPFAPRRSQASVERIAGTITGGNHTATAGGQWAGGSALGFALPAAPAQTGQGEHLAGVGTQASWGRTATGKSRSVWLWLGIAGATVAVAAGVVILRSQGSSGSPLTASTSAGAALPTPVPSSPRAPLLAPEPPSATASASSAVVAPSATTAAASKSSPAVTRQPSKPNLNPPSKPSGGNDPWGGSQH
jgi:eukaryotic-like serine/threonine-protein kinase